jgi:hypothetical protein
MIPPSSYQVEREMALFVADILSIRADVNRLAGKPVNASALRARSRIIRTLFEADNSPILFHDGE